MNGGGKKGLFGRMFGGAKPDEVAKATDADHEVEESGAGSPQGPAIDQPYGQTAEDTLRVDEPAEAKSDGETSIDEVHGDEVSVNEALSEQLPPKESSAEEEASEKGPATKSWFSRLKSGLTKSSHKLIEGITGIFTKSRLDDEALENLEDLLIQSDLGVAMAMRITERLAASRYEKDITGDEVRGVLAEEVTAILEPVAGELKISDAKRPFILLMVGVNGAGKTTTIGKLAQKFRGEGKAVMMAAGDTFRAGAIDQLKVWGERTGAEVIAKPVGTDASGLVFDALEAARGQNMDVLMIDTAGRLQNKTELMAELEKIVRVIKKFDETGPHEVILTLDATTGQNALNQVDIFGKTAGVTGLVMTKLDGSARGGILVAIADKFKLPVYAIGVGEGVEDMQPFEPADFANAIAGIEQADVQP